MLPRVVALEHVLFGSENPVAGQLLERIKRLEVLVLDPDEGRKFSGPQPPPPLQQRIQNLEDAVGSAEDGPADLTELPTSPGQGHSSASGGSSADTVASDGKAPGTALETLPKAAGATTVASIEQEADTRAAPATAQESITALRGSESVSEGKVASTAMLEEPAERPPASVGEKTGRRTNRMIIQRSYLHKFGFTDSCNKCQAILRDDDSENRVAHSSQCRARVAEAMSKDPTIRNRLDVASERKHKSVEATLVNTAGSVAMCLDGWSAEKNGLDCPQKEPTAGGVPELQGCSIQAVNSSVCDDPDVMTADGPVASPFKRQRCEDHDEALASVPSPPELPVETPDVRTQAAAREQALAQAEAPAFEGGEAQVEDLVWVLQGAEKVGTLARGAKFLIERCGESVGRVRPGKTLARISAQTIGATQLIEALNSFEQLRPAAEALRARLQGEAAGKARSETEAAVAAAARANAGFNVEALDDSSTMEESVPPVAVDSGRGREDVLSAGQDLSPLRAVPAPCFSGVCIIDEAG